MTIVPSPKSQRKLSGLPPGSVLPDASSTISRPTTPKEGPTSLARGGRVRRGLSGCTVRFVATPPTTMLLSRLSSQSLAAMSIQSTNSR